MTFLSFVLWYHCDQEGRILSASQYYWSKQALQIISEKNDIGKISWKDFDLFVQKKLLIWLVCFSIEVVIFTFITMSSCITVHIIHSVWIPSSVSVDIDWYQTILGFQILATKSKSIITHCDLIEHWAAPPAGGQVCSSGQLHNFLNLNGYWQNTESKKVIFKHFLNGIKDVASHSTSIHLDQLN